MPNLNDYMTSVVEKLNNRVKGLKIEKVVYQDMDGFSCPVIVLEDGTCFMAQADDEFNGPGVLVHYGKDLEELGMWQI